jgi:hypothetical protein
MQISARSPGSHSAGSTLEKEHASFCAFFALLVICLLVRPRRSLTRAACEEKTFAGILIESPVYKDRAFFFSLVDVDSWAKLK